MTEYPKQINCFEQVFELICKIFYYTINGVYHICIKSER